MKMPFFAKKLNFDDSTEISLSLTWGDVRASPRGVPPAFSQPKYFQKIKSQNIFISEKTQKQMPFSKNEISTIPPKFRFCRHEKTFEFHFRIFHHPFYSLNVFRKLSHKTYLSQRRDCPFSEMKMPSQKGKISTISTEISISLPREDVRISL